MAKTIFTVDGMSCEHCVKAISGAVGALIGVASVAVDLSAKTVMVEYDPAKTLDARIKSEIEDQGYEVVSSDCCC
ncbi:MAG: copper ion binding protein [Dehalococcoidia bacterium]|nr:copper ion binding protein [Dehalococcoidia bacterium]